MTQNTPVLFVVNSMAMTTFFGSRIFDLESKLAVTANSVFGQLKGHNSGVPGGNWLVIELGRDINYAHQHIHLV